MIQARQMLVSPDKYGIKCPFSMVPEYITVHNTGMDAPAVNEIKYMIGNSNEVSYHFAVDDKEVIQGIPTNRNAWHAGDTGKGTGNRKSIGIEICYSRSGGERYTKAEELAVKFIAQLLKERGWGVDRVKKHQDWSGKVCPHRILNEGRWDSFKSRIKDKLGQYETVPATLNGKQVKAIMVDGNTHISSIVLDLLNIINGESLPGVDYKGERYLQWNRIPGMKDAKQRKDGGFDFIATVQPKVGPKNEPKDVIDKMVEHGVINTPEYWKTLRNGKVAFNWEWVEEFMKNVDKKLEGK